MAKCIIISKQEFTSLYRFGILPISPIRAIDATKEDDSFYSDLFNSFISNPLFEGDEEYLVLKFLSEEKNVGNVEIKNVVEIIPLTARAKASLEMKFDPRINFSNPRFESIINKLEQYIDIQDRVKGINAVKQILLQDYPSTNSIKKEIIKKAYEARISGTKSFEISEDYITHLLVYERYDFFPNSDLGYFYDIGEVFAHSKGKQSFKGSGFYNFLEGNKESLKSEKLSSIIDLIEGSTEIESFKSQLIHNNTKQYISGALFYKFKEELLQKESIFETKIPDVSKWMLSKDKFVNELIESINLLGAFFGYKKFYDDLYEISNIKFFKPKLSKPLEYNPAYIKEEPTKEKEIIAPPKKASKKSQLAKNISSIEKEESKTSSSIVEGVLNDRELMKTDDPILAQIKKVIGLSEVKLENDVLAKLKDILKPLAGSQKLTKDNVLTIIMKEYPTEFEVPKKHTLKVTSEMSLFPADS